MANIRSVGNVNSLATQLGAFGKRYILEFCVSIQLIQIFFCSFVVEAFERACNNRFGYLILNMDPRASPIQRVSSLIFPEESVFPVVMVKSSF